VTPLRVLVADDHPPTRAGVRLALEAAGMTVCAEAPTAPTAVQAALEERPDVCLLDVHMPGSGIEAAREIVDRLPDTAVVMLTVSRNDDDLFKALKAGARGYLLKDMDPGRLPVALRGVLEGEAALPRSLVSRVLREFREREQAGTLVRPGQGNLTSREWEVLDCMSEGMTTAEIAKRLFLSVVTVRRHISSTLKKLHASSREDAVRIAKRRSRNLNAE
jgi:DNA-binding NarL/FixJ family response regulator